MFAQMRRRADPRQHQDLGRPERARRQDHPARGAQRFAPAAATDRDPDRAALLDQDLLDQRAGADVRSEEHTSELQSLMRISYAVFCLKKQNTPDTTTTK